MFRDALFSDCGKYRYTLRRVWDSALDSLVVIGLNPSTADETQDDPTIRRCIGFARRERFGGILMLNLFAYRSTDPKVLGRVTNPIGPLNDQAIDGACDGKTVLVAWGARGCLHNRDQDVLKMLYGQKVVCLGFTQAGQPCHPLYLRADTPFTRMYEVKP